MTAGGALAETTRRRRLYSRVDGGQLPFIPYGLAPLLGLGAVLLFALIPFALGAIEQTTRETAQKALAGIGAAWATPRVSGQWVEITGQPPSAEAGEQALAAVRAAKAPALVFQAVPATRVTAAFGAPAAGLLRPTATPTQVVEATPQPQPQPQPVSTPAPTPSAAVTPEAVAACDKSMAKLLGDSSIQFETRSAGIEPGSIGLLDDVARAAALCPGTLRIAGHTDNVGSGRFNKSLSQLRAETVKQELITRGVPADRLIAEGDGESKPIASNKTEDGRARNRRIEIRVAPNSN